MKPNSMGIYIHIPFCVSKCQYCSFFSVPTDQRAGRYTAALKKELAMRTCDTPISSIYIGGGTPSVLPHSEIGAILDAVRRYYHVAPHCEITCEANPESLGDKAAAYRAYGVNRLSVGIQAVQPALLQMLGRPHSFEDAQKAIVSATEAGIPNCSADLMFGLPGQTVAQWQESLHQVARLGISHLSCYALQVEEGTPLARRLERGLLPTPDEDLTADMLACAKETLQQYGLHRYEISNYAKAGKESRHNCNYWENGAFLAFGAGAHGAIPQEQGILRYENTRDINAYIQAIEQGTFSQTVWESSPSEERFEYIMLRTRMVKGVPLGAFAARFGQSLSDVYPLAVQKCLQHGMAILGQDAFALTERGMEVQNSVLQWFLEE